MADRYDESWEFQNNTSNRMLFKDADFERMYIDPETLEEYPEWKNDFEARFPDDTYEDVEQLKAFMEWIVSTDREQATDETLPEPVTYGGVEYTTDSADYRLAKFNAEIEDYVEIESMIFYYVFTEFFLQVDSRAKNFFLGFHGGSSPVELIRRKGVSEPYDMDTAMGTNNEGTLAYSPYLEDTDLVDGAYVFNGQTSVLWNNLRDTRRAAIVNMYQTLRSSGGLNYANVEARFEEAQKTWPEAIWNEDAQSKYFDPLVNPGAGKEPTDFYLPMNQGSKEQQRKWWLTNRFAYMDSKWNAGDALAQVIQLRGYAKADITVTPYIDLYPTVKYGSYLVQKRGKAGVGMILECPLDSVNDTEIYVYSAKQIASIGDISGLKVGVADFSYAVNIQEIKVGDASASYDNPNMKRLGLGSNVLLKKVDARNCSLLGTDEQKSVDMSNCPIIEEVYFDGTAIQGLSLPNGGVLKKLHVPATMTNLTIMNQKNITEFVIPSYNNITTLRIENSSVDSEVMLRSVPANTRVRLIGFTWEAEDAEEIEDLLDLLDTMRGLDEQGNNVETAQVSGVIHTASLTGEEVARFQGRYPYLTIRPDHVSSVLTYKSYDGETTLKTVQCLDGVPQESAPTIPTRADSADGHYSYTAVGWSREMDSQTADPDASVDVIADRTIYAAYSRTEKSYTVTWVDNGTTIETDTNVLWGTVPHYDGATPTKDGQTSTGWLPDPTQPITGNTTFTAQYLPVYTVTFKNDTGSTTLDTQSVVQGGTATYGGTTPESSEDPTLAFLGWATSANSHTANAVLTNVQASMTVYAAFESSVEVAEITDSWDTIIANIDNGTYSTKYKVGNYKPLDLGTVGTINMQIVAMDADELASGGYAPLTFIGMDLLNTKHVMFSSADPGSLSRRWSNSTLKTYLDGTIINKISQNISERIQQVKKYSAYATINGKIVGDDLSSDKLWIPSKRELGISNTYDTKGVIYNKIYYDNNSRIKESSDGPKDYWLRSVYSYSNSTLYFDRIRPNSGECAQAGCTNSFGICLGFCLGLEPETITDSWETILENENPSASYSVGDTKSISINGENHLM